MNEIERLKATLRRIVVTCGGYAQPGVSTDFLESTADEVEAMVGNYNARIAALTAELDALAAWACDQYDDGDEQFGRRAGVARGRELLTERDALKAELTRVMDLAEKDRAAFADTLCFHRTALRETREALKAYSADCGVCRATAVLAKHAALAEGGDRG